MRGFSMIETLVALVVLSLGLLGIARLFVAGMADNRSALHRSQAVHLARDLAERIRANRGAGMGGGAYLLNANGEPLLQDCITAVAGCTPIALAQDDLSRWLVAIHDTLPGDGSRTPGGTVAVNTATTPATYTITVSWSEPGAGERSFVLQVQA